MFSRPINPIITEIDQIENTVIENNTNSLQNVVHPPLKKPENVLSSFDYFNKKLRLDKYKIADLKETLKYYKSTVCFIKNNNYNSSQIKSIKAKYDFGLTGKKEDLIRRIHDLFEKEKSAICVQKHFRKYLVQTEINLRGPALKNRKLCVNDNDFYTLEPLRNISFCNFFSYKGEGDFVYGFDLTSIIELVKNNRNNKLLNPYNRESMHSIITTIQHLCRLNKISRNNAYIKTNTIAPKSITRSGNNYRDQPNTPYTLSRRQVPEYFQDTGYNPERVIEELRRCKLKPLTQRINDLFIEIDQLGNYTQSEWFSSLTRQDLIRLFRCLYDIWNYRAQLSFDIKRKICPVSDPFGGMPFSQPYLSLTDDQLKSLCLTVMERMVLSGIDNDHKMIGTMHVLTGLTIVSQNARTSLPWLYESLVF
jgi:hypothetical protein